MENVEATEEEREMARMCLQCPCCKTARLEQKGLVYTCIKNFAEGLCPFCQAYEKVFGLKGHEPAPNQ
jgi:hypothetical protein